MSYQVGIGSLGETVFSGETLYPSANYALCKIMETDTASEEFFECNQMQKYH